MATFQVTNPNAGPAIVYVADYLGKKFKQAQEQYGKPLKSIESTFEDENGKRWKLSFGPEETSQEDSE